MEIFNRKRQDALLSREVSDTLLAANLLSERRPKDLPKAKITGIRTRVPLTLEKRPSSHQRSWRLVHKVNLSRFP